MPMSQGIKKPQQKDSERRSQKRQKLVENNSFIPAKTPQKKNCGHTQASKGWVGSLDIYPREVVVKYSILLLGDTKESQSRVQDFLPLHPVMNTRYQLRPCGDPELPLAPSRNEVPHWDIIIGGPWTIKAFTHYPAVMRSSSPQCQWSSNSHPKVEQMSSSPECQGRLGREPGLLFQPGSHKVIHHPYKSLSKEIESLSKIIDGIKEN